MASGGHDEVVIRVDDADATTHNEEQNMSCDDFGVTTSGVNGGRTTPRIGVKLKMPSTQLTTATKIFNRLVELAKGDLDDPESRRQTMETMKSVERHLAVVWNALSLINPVDEVQKMFKEQWTQKHVLGKERFIRNLKEAMKLEVASRSSRKSSKSSRALNAARAREAVLKLKKKHIEEMQEVELQLESARLEREALEQELGSDEDEPNREELHLVEDSERLGGAWLHSRFLQEEMHQEEGAGRCDAEHHQTRHPGRTEQSNREQADIRREQLSGAAQSHLLEHVLLAQAKLPIFKGEELEFVWFMKAFEEQVEAVTTDSKRRLYLLLQQLQGEPHVLVKGCQLAFNADQGYAAAKALLNEKYGNTIRQSQAFKEKLLTWPNVKTTADIRSFCVQLQLCQQVGLHRGGMDELNAASTLFKLVSKLPVKMRSSWQTKVGEIELNQQRQVKFEDLVALVQKFDRARNHPIFGKLEVERKDDSGPSRSSNKPQSQTTSARASVMVTECPTESEPAVQVAVTRPGQTMDAKKHNVVNAWKPPCLFCNENHATAKCLKANCIPRKDRLDKLQGVCFGCLKPGHQARGCKARLKCDKCGKMHPTVLHADLPKESPSETPAKQENRSAVESLEETPIKKTNLATNCQPEFAVAVVPICVQGGTAKTTVVVRSILDNASTASFITQRLVQKLNLKSVPSSLTVTTMAGTETIAVSVVYGLRITDLNENENLLVHQAFVVKELPFANECPLTAESVANWTHLAAIPFNFVNAPLDMLLGQDVPRAVAPISAVRGGPEDPYAVRTALGWSLQGPLGTLRRSQAQTLAAAATAADVAKKLDQIYFHDFDCAYNFWSKGLSTEDRWWLKTVEASAQRSPTTGHYTVSLPIREGAPTMQDNYEQAIQRLMSLKRQFAHKPQFERDYKAFMTKMESEGFIEWVESGIPQAKQVSYVLHHGVYHPRKPGKLRVVFNCASKYKGIALNDCLVPGPDLTNSIVGVLLRFRQYPVAFMADVDAMFYQVLVPQDQRDMLRLLWWRDGKVAVCRLRVHLFGATSSPGVANFILRKAAKDALAAKVPAVTGEVVNCVHKNFYVDDCLKSVPTEQDAVRLLQGLQAACAFGGFHLSKFLSNQLSVLTAVNRKDWAKDVNTAVAEANAQWADRIQDVDMHSKIDPLGSIQERALGVAWKVANDEFIFKIGMQAQQQVTKRIVLSNISKLYDPLGVAAPVVIVARIFFRALTKDETIASWDEPLSEVLQKHWNSWMDQLANLEKVKMPRCFWSQTPVKAQYQLHAFCDASNDAYAAVVYVKNGNQVAFAFGKARVTPPKTVTIPRLELVAAKLAAEIMTMVSEELDLPIERRVLWSDSTTVLKYLNNSSKRFATFVSNRIEAILHLTRASEWRYVPTNLNPADVGSRGILASALQDSVWIQGPQFLTEAESEWPTWPQTRDDNADIAATTCSYQDECQEPQVCFIEAMALRYSSMRRFRKAVAIWLRFKEYLRFRRRPTTLFTMQATELKGAEREAIKCLQAGTWANELKQSDDNADGQPIKTTRSSPLHKLSPVWNNKIICTDTRTREQLPIVPKGQIAKLLVKEAHEKQGHLGRSSTTAEALRGHWVLGLNKMVRKVIRDCRVCRFWKTKPQIEKMAPLPNFRRQQGTKAFETTGVDYFGPFLVKQQGEVTKMYGVLFTCAASRAVHLEVAPDLSSSGFVNALRRFIARRGQVKLLVSDNGTNFDGANTQMNQELQLELDQLKESAEHVFNEMKQKGIEWRFNVPGASHHGGFWERLIRTIRRILQVTLAKTSKPQMDEFITTMCECEAILNNRPLTAASEDPNDFEALTPNHLLIGDKGGEAMPGQYETMTQHLQRRWKAVQNQVQRFWKRWCDEYLVLLRQRTKWHVAAKNVLKHGDVVLMVEPLKPRNYWKMGRVDKLWRSTTDNHIRAVDVKTAIGTFTRPITKVCLLEATE